MVAAISISPHHHTLRTYIVLNNKANRPRLASFTDLLEYGSIDPTMKKTSPKNEDFPEECLAFESYAAVASRFHSTSPTRDIRWSDLNRPRLHLATALFTSTRLSQKLRKRQIRRARSSKGNPNDHLQVSALELCFEFLDLTDLVNTTMVCTEFRDTVYNAPSLLLGWYARKWCQQETMANAYYAIGYSQLLDMCRARRSDSMYELSTRSQVTLRPDATCEVINNSLLRSFKRGSIDSIRGIKPLPILSCAQVFQKNLSYYEVSMKGCGSVGIVSISDVTSRDAYGFCSEEHVGWKGISFGYHGNDGDFVYNDGSAPYGGEWKPYGPSWGGINTHEDKSAEMYTIGCGLNLDTNELFFTRNGMFLGIVPFTIPCSEYAAAISLHEFGDQCIVNAGSAPFTFDIEGFCASS